MASAYAVRMVPRWGVVVAMAMLGCHASPSSPPSTPPPTTPPIVPSTAPVAPPASAEPAEPPEDSAPPPSPLGDDTPRSLANLAPRPDRAPGKRARHDTAVLLFSPRVDPDAPPSARVFQPLVCAIAGKRATGARCGEIMPARAKLRTSEGELVVARSTQPFHDEAGQQDYPAPYGPTCCMYNTCRGRTVLYRAARGDRRARETSTMLAVWPADAEISLEVARDEITPGVSPPIHVGQKIEASFRRGDRSYAALRGPHGGIVAWDVGAGWVTSQADIGPRGYTLLATSDVDHDGQLELIAYQRWANDYGLDVFGDAAVALYSFSCGNI